MRTHAHTHAHTHTRQDATTPRTPREQRGRDNEKDRGNDRDGGRDRVDDRDGGRDRDRGALAVSNECRGR